MPKNKDSKDAGNAKKLPDADAKFKQEGAFCKVLAARWCACLLGTNLDDRDIMNWITGSNLVETFVKRDGATKFISQDLKETFNNNTLSRPTEKTGGYTDINNLVPPMGNTNTLYAPRETVSYMVRLAHTGGEASAAAIVAELEQNLMGGQKGGGGRYASIHYKYKSDGRQSGHSVGFYAQPRTSNRTPPFQFFDPNNGSWGFSSLRACLEFFSIQWLPRFVSGNMRGDPGEPTDKERELTYFTINEIILCAPVSGDRFTKAVTPVSVE